MTTLEGIPLLRNLSRSDLHILQSIVKQVAFVSGQEIFHEGAPGDGVYFVKSGCVEISAGSGARRVFSRLGSGEIFGEMAIIEHRPRSATATAAENTEVYFLPRGELLPFVQHSPGLSFALLQHISQRLREFNQLHLREIVEAERLAAIGHFARGIVHDLKNPLSIIGLTAGMLSNAVNNPDASAQVQTRILRQVQRINDLVSDILIFTGGSQQASLQPADFRALALEFTAELQADLVGKPVRLSLENQPPTVLVACDRRSLGRVFNNLVQNAADVLESGGNIFLRFKTSPGEVTIEVEDTGPGLAPAIADKIFQPFATHGKSHGTGLGLSICKKIVEDHGGKISARSAPGRGAVFSFTLPLVK